MNPLLIGYLVDGVLSLLLVIAMIQGYRLHRAFERMRSGQTELHKVIGSLNASVSEAQRGVAALKAAASEAEEQIRSESRKARALVDELSLITEAGNNLADRIEKRLTGSTAANAPPPAEGAAEAAAADAGAPAGEAQKELLSALKSAR